MVVFTMLELNFHGLLEKDEDFGLGIGERLREIVLEDEGETMREERQRSKHKKTGAIVSCSFSLIVWSARNGFIIIQI